MVFNRFLLELPRFKGKKARNTMNTEHSNQQNSEINQMKNHFLLFLNAVRRMFPNLYSGFNAVDAYDPRNQLHVVYPMAMILLIVFLKNALSYISMRSFWSSFDEKMVIENILYLTGATSININKLPHFQTVNDFMSALNPMFLDNLTITIFKTIIDRKLLYNYRYNKLWVIAVDATQIYRGSKKIHEKCLYCVHNRGKENEYTEYYISILVASLVLVGTKVSIPFCCMFIENNAEDAERQRSMSEQSIKQDCETKAFKRLAETLKVKLRHMEICILFDSLYASKPIMEICLNNGWNFIIRYKDGSYPEIQQDVDKLRQKKMINMLSDNESAKHDYRDVYYSLGHVLSAIVKVNYIHATSILAREKYVSFQWITSLPINDVRVYKLINVGRARWLIENQTFQRLKHWSNNIEHLCCLNECAVKNHFRMIIITEMFRIFYEFETFSKEEKNTKPTFERIREKIRFGFWTLRLSTRPWTAIYAWKSQTGRGRPKCVDIT